MNGRAPERATVLLPPPGSHPLPAAAAAVAALGPALEAATVPGTAPVPAVGAAGAPRHLSASVGAL